jgi:hyperosmotically inducible protein
MKTRTLWIGAAALAGVLLGPLAAVAGEDVEIHPKAFVKDSVITTKIKTRLAADHLTSLARIHVDTDEDGVVWLNGTAHSQEAVDKAVQIARDTEHVRGVHSDIVVRRDD